MKDDHVHRLSLARKCHFNFVLFPIVLLFFVTNINFKDDQTEPTFEMTPGFKPFTLILRLTFISIYI